MIVKVIFVMSWSLHSRAFVFSFAILITQLGKAAGALRAQCSEKLAMFGGSATS